MRFTAHQLAIGFREVRVIPQGSITLTCEGGLYVVRLGTWAQKFSQLTPARLMFDNLEAEFAERREMMGVELDNSAGYRNGVARLRRKVA